MKRSIKILVVLVLLTSLISCNKTQPSKEATQEVNQVQQNTAEEKQSNSNQNEKAKDEPFVIAKCGGTIGAGTYEVGKDIPAGDYDIYIHTAYDNFENITVKNLDTGKEVSYTKDDLESKKTIRLDNRMLVTTSYADLDIKCDKAEFTNHKLRTNHEGKKAYEAGEYIIGKNIPAGVYNINTNWPRSKISVDGKQKATITSMVGTNLPHEYHNFILNEGEKLTIDGTVELAKVVDGILILPEEKQKYADSLNSR